MDATSSRYALGGGIQVGRLEPTSPMVKNRPTPLIRQGGKPMALKPIAYVQAAWHTDITDHCRTAFMAEMAKHGYGTGDVQFFPVPGSLEVPLMAPKAAQAGRYAAVGASRRGVDRGL